MKTFKKALVLSVIALWFSCNNNNSSEYANDKSYAPSEEYALEESYDSESPSTSRMATKSKESSGEDYKSMVSSSISRNSDSGKLLIKTVDMRFKVENVYQSTLRVEELTEKMGGFVSSNNLNSSVDWEELTPISKDSSLETTRYTVNNYLQIRVPNQKLEQTLMALAEEIDFLDNRSIRAEDVSLQIKANEMIIENAAKFEQKLNDVIKNRGGKVEDAIRAEELIQLRKEQADRAIIANVNLMDRIEYSTLNVNMYQRESVKRVVLANNENVDAYRPGLFTQVWDSLKTGWYWLSDAVIFIAKLWGFILAGFLIYFGIKYFRRRKAK